MRGAGRATFAAILLLIAGTLNIIYGIGALDSANIFANDTRYIFTDLNTMGWVPFRARCDSANRGLLADSGQQLGSLVIGIIAGSLGAINALLSVGGQNPWWSACHLLPVRVDRLRHRRPRRRRARAGDQSSDPEVGSPKGRWSSYGGWPPWSGRGPRELARRTPGRDYAACSSGSRWPGSRTPSRVRTTAVAPRVAGRDAGDAPARALTEVHVELAGKDDTFGAPCTRSRREAAETGAEQLPRGSCRRSAAFRNRSRAGLRLGR